MASTKVLRVVSDELTEVLGLDEGRIAAKLPALSGLKGKPLADALLAEAEDIYTTDTISEESVKVLKTLGWAGPKEPPVEDGEDDENKSNLPLPDVTTMDHDDLLEELEHLDVKIPVKLRKETAATMTKLRALVIKNRPEPKEEKPAKPEKKEKAVKKEAVKKETTTEKTKLGHRVGTFASSMDELLLAGTTVEAGVASLGKIWKEKKENTIRAALKTHIKYLTKKGITITEKEGLITAKP